MDVHVNSPGVSASTNTVQLMRAAVAKWYYIMRLIASIILLAILIVVGIKMAISSVAEEKALYKKALVDWAVSLALIFLLQFIISFTVMCNSALVKSLAAVGGSTTSGDEINKTIEDIRDMANNAFGWETIAATIVFVAISVQTLAFLFQYIKRMINIGFLIIISPLISITYSIDRMGDGKSQALNTWLKEFVFGVLIQPFHCVLYLAFVDMAFQLLKGGADAQSKIANGALAVMCITFVDDGEKIVKKIFGLDASSAVSPVAAGAMLGATAAFASQKAPQMLAGAKKGITNFTQKGLGSKIAKDYKADRTQRFQNLLGDKNQTGKANKALARAGLERGEDGIIRDKTTKDVVDESKAAERMYDARASKNIAHPVKAMKGAASKKYGSMAAAHKEKQIKNIEDNMLAGMSDSDKEYYNSTDEGKAKLREMATKEYNNRPSQKIGRFASKVGNSNTGRYLRNNLTVGKMLGKSFAGGTALFAASAGLAAPGQGVLAAATAGLGTYAALKGLGSNSASNVATTAAPHFHVSNSQEARTKINSIIENKSDYDDNSNKFRELEQKLTAAIYRAMGGKGSESEAASKARAAVSAIKYETTRDPEKMNGDALAGILKAKTGMDVTEDMFKRGLDVKNHVDEANVCRAALPLLEGGYTAETIADKFYSASTGSTSQDMTYHGEFAKAPDLPPPPPAQTTTPEIDMSALHGNLDQLVTMMAAANAVASGDGGSEDNTARDAAQEMIVKVTHEVKQVVEVEGLDQAQALLPKLQTVLDQLKDVPRDADNDISRNLRQLDQYSAQLQQKIDAANAPKPGNPGNSGDNNG